MLLVALFLTKNKTIFQSKAEEAKQTEGLTYNTEIVENLVNKDTDGDGILDWEEGLWGTNPTKKETTPGTPDRVAIERLKAEQAAQNGEGLPSPTEAPGTLTETDKFSQEFFATVSTLTQNGAMDQTTVDKLSTSIAEHIQNTPQRKVYKLSDLKVTKDTSTQAIKKYNDTLNAIYTKNPTKNTVIDVMQKFVGDGNDVNVSALSELDPIIKEFNRIIVEMTKMNTPQSLASLHLDVVNGFEKIVENLNDIKLFNTDVIVALSGMSQYESNANALVSANQKLAGAMNTN